MSYLQESVGFLLAGGIKLAVIPLLGLCLIQSVVNMMLLRRLKSAACDSESTQDLSILVPARNEEIRIRECLLSLIAQHPPVREIILLDDRSSDRTAQIAMEIGFSENPASPLRLLRGKELPEGWVGKNWACHQLSLAANPQSGHLLFTDADTVHSPDCARTALAHALSERADLLSLWPKQATLTWSEKIVIPIGYLLFMSCLSLPTLHYLQARPCLVRRWRIPPTFLASIAIANGQFLLFRKEAYEAVGGHEALKNHLVEDVAFGRRIAARTGEGMRLLNADGGVLLRCRMYLNFMELWEGFSKNLRPVFEESNARFFLFILLSAGLFLFPFLALGVTRVNESPALIAILLIFTLRLLLTLRFRTSWLSLVAHPFGVALALIIALNSWRLCGTKGVIWKGRTYSGSTPNSLG